SYDAYGNVSFYDGSGTPISQSAIGNDYLFTGRRYDPETGLYCYRARYYSPEMGRFLNRDPAEDDSLLNLYAYVGNNPVNRTDPWGLFTIKIDNFLPGTMKLEFDNKTGNLSSITIDIGSNKDIIKKIPGGKNIQIKPYTKAKFTITKKGGLVLSFDPGLVLGWSVFEIVTMNSFAFDKSGNITNGYLDFPLMIGVVRFFGVNEKDLIIQGVNETMSPRIRGYIGFLTEAMRSTNLFTILTARQNIVKSFYEHLTKLGKIIAALNEAIQNMVPSEAKPKDCPDQQKKDEFKDRIK
ncbi:RHS repeat-associated core domain-containing protein, partial [Planctomycetota bacterium]